MLKLRKWPHGKNKDSQGQGTFDFLTIFDCKEFDSHHYVRCSNSSYWISVKPQDDFDLLVTSLFSHVILTWKIPKNQPKVRRHRFPRNPQKFVKPKLSTVIFAILFYSCNRPKRLPWILTICPAGRLNFLQYDVICCLPDFLINLFLWPGESFPP